MLSRVRLDLPQDNIATREGNVVMSSSCSTQPCWISADRLVSVDIFYNVPQDWFWTWLSDFSYMRLWASCLPECGVVIKINTITFIGKDSHDQQSIVDSMSVDHHVGRSFNSRDKVFRSCLHIGGVNGTFCVADDADIGSSFRSNHPKVTNFIQGTHEHTSIILRCIFGPNSK